MNFVTKMPQRNAWSLFWQVVLLPFYLFDDFICVNRKKRIQQFDMLDAAGCSLKAGDWYQNKM